MSTNHNETNENGNSTLKSGIEASTADPSLAIYESTKHEEMGRELLMRKELIQEDIIPFLLQNVGLYVLSSKTKLALTRYGAVHINPQMTQLRDIEKLLPIAHQYQFQPFQLLMSEL